MKKTDFNSGWLYGHSGGEKRAVTLPHDAMFHDGRSAEEPTGSAGAFFRGGAYEYEKEFFAPADADQRTLIMQFEGVMRNAKVFVNGIEVGGAPYGYIPFWVDLGRAIRPGESNAIRVTADTRAQPASRWYAGGGIYRPVWLWEGGRAVILPQGVRVRTLSVENPRIEVEILTGELPGRESDYAAEIEILGADGKRAAGCIVGIAGGSGKAALEMPGAALWSEEDAAMYTCRVVLKKGDAIADEARTAFGIRMVEKRADGLYVNGRNTLLRGGSIHHDNGVIGAVSAPEMERRRIRIMKENGFNAVRIAHNPASEALLQAADECGMYVIDETWDMWYNHKSAHDYAGDFPAHYLSDIQEMVSRDYSHPSVIMYSIGNEVSEPASPKGLQLGREIIGRFHALDPSRPVTGGINIMILSQSAKGSAIYDEEGGRDTSSEEKAKNMSSLMFNVVASMVGSGMNRAGNSKKADAVSTPILDALDVCGYNYGSGRYPLEGKAHPGRLVYGSEIFPQDAAKNWAVIQKYPWLVGDFLWSGWDYIGECGAGAWSYAEDGKGFEKPYPWKLADVGALDILGDPNAEMFWAQAGWGTLKGVRLAVRPANHPGAKIAKAAWRGTNGLPGWSWQGCDGNKVTVEAFTAGTSVELFLNGKKIGKKRTKNGRAVFHVKYAPGELKAIARDASGAVLGEDALISAQGDLRLQCGVAREKTPEACAMETVAVEISVCGGNGVPERNRDVTLSAEVQGGELLGFGSANPRTEEDFTGGVYTTYYGRALAVVRKEKGAQARLILSEAGAADGLRAEVQL